MEVAAQKPTTHKRHLGGKAATIISAVLWLVGFGLSFCVSSMPANCFWLPDFLLLAGFLPLLYFWKAGWPWLVFGLLNVFIGFVLEVSFVLSEDLLTAQMIEVRHHMEAEHAPLVWILVGAASAMFGLFRIANTIIRWAINRRKRRDSQEPT